MYALSKQVIFIIIIFLAFHTLAGCSDMALKTISKSNEPVILTEKSIALFSLTTDNSFNGLWVPTLWGVKLESVDGKLKKTLRLHDSIIRKMTENGEMVNNQIASVFLEPGDYNIVYMSGTTVPYQSTDTGYFQKYFKYQFNVQPDEICYVGHIRFHSRQKQPGENVGAPPIPIFNQLFSGVHDCYWEVRSEYGDLYNDIQYVKGKVPAIRNHIINIRIGQLLEQD